MSAEYVVGGKLCIFPQVPPMKAQFTLGWWHLVVNLSESIAVTQNFVPPAQLPAVLRFLRYKQDQISGFNQSLNVYDLFTQNLQKTNPELLRKAESELENARSTEKRKWIPDTESTAFTFNFF